ncbi:hypothetical protein SFRURICE_014881 [Spodoptera frugiperda]|nr:hypothetical protein SFRURICE_014881 [Spodoptera frugiperda]
METNANQKVSCVVNFAYDASEPDELTVRPGDVIRDVERLPGGWWRGELRGRRGMPTRVQGQCRAVFSYQPANPDELPLCVGDVLEVLGEVEEGWWQGRRQGRVGVFPSNFVVMLDPRDPPQPAPPFEPAPALPPKPVKELCRVLFPYTAVNEDELTLSEGDIVTILSKEAPDRGWWRGELNGRVGLFPDNFVQALPPQVATELEEKKPERPPAKTTNSIYPILSMKHSEKTASVKEHTSYKISSHKENTISKESSTQSTVTHTNKTESEKIIHSETVSDGTLDQVKKPPVPLKKSPTPTSERSRSSTTVSSSGSSSGGEWDRPDGAAPSKATNNTNTFDHIERNSLLNDPRAGRVKAPRRRPPSQALREDTPLQLGLSNGHEGRTIMSMLDDIKKPPAPPPPTTAPPPVPTLPRAVTPPVAAAPPPAPASNPPPIRSAVATLSAHIITDKSSSTKIDKSPVSSDKPAEVTAVTRQISKTSTIERIEKSLDKVSSATATVDNKPSTGTLERRMQPVKTEKIETNDALIAQLNDRITNLEKLIEVQNTVFNTAIEDLKAKLSQESEKRQALQSELEKLAHCVTQV